MPNDAKLGLVLGVGLVIAVAVVFTRKDAAATASHGGENAPAAVNPATPVRPSPRGQFRPTEAKPTSQQDETAETVSAATEATDERP